MNGSDDFSIQIAQESLRQSQISFDRAQSYYCLGWWSAAATATLGIVTAVMLLTGNADRATVGAASCLPMAITTRILREGGKRLDESRNQLREIERSHE